MAKGYKYEIVGEQDGYCFKLFPNNSRTQCIGTSGYYKDVSACQKAIKDFKDMLSRDKISENFGNHLDVKREEGKYKFYFSDDETNILFYRDKGYYKKRAAKML